MDDKTLKDVMFRLFRPRPLWSPDIVYKKTKKYVKRCFELREAAKGNFETTDDTIASLSIQPVTDVLYEAAEEANRARNTHNTRFNTLDARLQGNFDYWLDWQVKNL